MYIPLKTGTMSEKSVELCELFEIKHIVLISFSNN